MCALLSYFRFRWDERDGEQWTPATMFGSKSGGPITDPLTLEERKQIRNAVLEYKTVKWYNSDTADERDSIKTMLAQRLGKPKEKITKKDWEKANTDWLYPPLIMVALDIGLRPCVAERLKVSWVELSDKTIKIPKEDAAKNDEYWSAAIDDRTARLLQKWIEQREHLPKYEGSDILWLTREGNPFTSGPLARRLRDIMDEAGIDYGDRDISMYSIRHSLGSELARTDNLRVVQKQLRHKTIEVTLRYVHPTDETIREGLSKI